MTLTLQFHLWQKLLTIVINGLSYKASLEAFIMCILNFHQVINGTLTVCVTVRIKYKALSQCTGTIDLGLCISPYRYTNSQYPVYYLAEIKKKTHDKSLYSFVSQAINLYCKESPSALRASIRRSLDLTSYT